jgi:F0F1-type ATP synthase gamma subunit
MNSILIEATESTPAIKCDFEHEFIEISGRSIPENAVEFYSPLAKWLKDYQKTSKQNLNLIFFLDYINSISYKMVFEILLIAEKIKQDGKTVSILWKYEEDDDQILEEGTYFSSKLDIPFSFEEVPESGLSF